MLLLRFGKACSYDMASETEARLVETELRHIHRDARSEWFIRTLPGMVIGTLLCMVIGSLPGMVIGTLPGMVIGGAALACFKEEVELVNIQREGGAWKGGNLNLCGVLDISPNFVFQAASCLHCFSTLLFSFFFFPR